MLNHWKRMAFGLTLVMATAGSQAATLTVTPNDSLARLHFSETSNLGRLSLPWGPFQVSTKGLPGTQVTWQAYGFDGLDLAVDLPIETYKIETAAGGVLGKARVTDIATRGGISLTVAAPGTGDPFVATGGHAEISGLRIDLLNKEIRADVFADGVLTENLAVWSIDGQEGPDWVHAPQNDCELSRSCDTWSTYVATGYLERRYLDQVRLTGLTMTQQAADLLSHGLGLGPRGQQAFGAFQNPDWYNNVTFSPVPELDSAMMMALGLAGLWRLRNARARAASR